MTKLLRTLPALLLVVGCGAGSASAGASVDSNGNVSADANASVDTPGGTLGASAGTSGSLGASASTGGTAGTSGGSYVAQGGTCAEEWVHMPLVINFPSGGTIIDAQNRAVLDEMVRSAQGRTDLMAVRVEGHTDTCGNEVNNMSLSQQRAETVAMELVRMGVPRERVQTIGFGSTQPRANEGCHRRGQDDLSRNMNRRVEFSLLVCR